jgi:hypothetical protein
MWLTFFYHHGFRPLGPENEKKFIALEWKNARSPR